MSQKNNGFGAVAIITIIVVIVISGLIGWKVWDTYFNKKAVNTTQLNQTSDTPTPTVVTNTVPEIVNNTDLENAESILDSENVEGQQIKQLDAETNF